MALFIRPQIPTLISSSHADLKSCTPNLSMTLPPNTDILKNIMLYCAEAWTLNKELRANIEAFEMQCYRRDPQWKFPPHKTRT